MRKIINHPEDIVSELLEGFSLAFPEKIKMTDKRIITRAIPKDAGKVALVTLGGSGHEPALSGFVGRGLLDASVPGEIFAAPAPDRCFEAMKNADRGAGVLLIVLNHAGDVLSANYALEMARRHELNVRMVLIHDDIASGPSDKKDERRGLVGVMPVIKIAGAAAESGLSLKEVVSLAAQVEKNTRTLAVGFSVGTHPVTGESSATIADNMMVIGLGQHGESGSQQIEMTSADELADLMLGQLIEDLGAQKGDNLLVTLNGAGATTLMELFIVFRRIRKVLDEKGIHVVRSSIGEFITTQEQAGFQFNLTRLDQDMVTFWDAPCDAPYFTMS
jgi:dihydroxyacetone kinase-like protein